MTVEQTITLLIVIYFVGMNIAGFASMGIDKRKAIRGAYRISEAALFTLALLGGSMGSILGMQLFRHKTKHWYFVLGMPAILIVQIMLILFFIW